MLDILAIVGTLIFDSAILLLVAVRPGTLKYLLRRLRGGTMPPEYVDMDVTRKSILQEGIVYYWYVTVFRCFRFHALPQYHCIALFSGSIL